MDYQAVLNFWFTEIDQKKMVGERCSFRSAYSPALFGSSSSSEK